MDRTRFRGATAALLAALALTGGVAHAAAPLTYGNDAARSGWYPDESQLHPQLVTGGSFGRLFSTAVNGQVYAQPRVSHGGLFGAPEANGVSGPRPQSGAVEWSRNPGPAFDAPVPPVRFGRGRPRVGLTGTPVIDPDSGTAYLFAKTYES